MRHGKRIRLYGCSQHVIPLGGIQVARSDQRKADKESEKSHGIQLRMISRKITDSCLG